MNQEQFKSFWEQLKAPLQMQWNKLTDEDLLQIDGNVIKFDGVLDTRYGVEQETVRKWANRRFSHWSGRYEGYEYAPIAPPSLEKID
jgi:uncharacterized protein YjbJ (UPF0337 family)